MKFILFCKQAYAFSILKPLEEEILKRNFEVLWYIPKNIREIFPYSRENLSSDIRDLIAFKSDVIFVPGNEVPHFLHGVKVQIFHGLAGEKKGHFRIRDYFDLYLTPGPYFTSKFNELRNKHKNFEVQETGWSKLDELYHKDEWIMQHKKALLEKYNVKKIILYAPTFSPSLTSAAELYQTIEKVSQDKNILVVIKFHDLMDSIYKEKYSQLEKNNLFISQDKNIINLMKISDIMISDTSSVVYEYILLNKPVITLNNRSLNDSFDNIIDKQRMLPLIYKTLEGNDDFREKRKELINSYHPYRDSYSSIRMVDAACQYIQLHTVPKKRRISLLRKLKIYKEFGVY